MQHKVQEVIEHIQHWSMEDLLEIRDAIDELLRQRENESSQEPSHSILELKGLGSEIWRAIDVDEYIEQERASWEKDDLPIQATPKALHDVREFRGIACGMWDSVGGVDEFIRQERASWDD
jgi:hypothetical protein